MALALRLALFGGFALLMAVAAIEDARRLVIPNRVVVGLGALWAVRLAIVPPGFAAGVEAVGGAAAVFAVGAVLFARGVVGGGDVKLLTVAALWAGGEAIAPLLLVTALLGGGLALLLLTRCGAALAAPRWAGAAQAGADLADANSTRVPYGVAIAGAAVLVTISSQLG